MSHINVVIPQEDKTSFIKNPYMGWSVYVEYGCTLHEKRGNDPYGLCINADCPELYFDRLDSEIKRGLKPSILYIRLGWQWFEPQKGVYAWRDPSSILSRYIQRAKERQMQIAFRILVSDEYHGDDVTKHTVPAWLFDEQGFEFYLNNEKSRTPYYDNKTYLKYYERLICELAKDFDNPALVAYADAQGLGTWGEMHDIRTKGIWTKDQAIEEHAKIWTKYFKNILLGATFGGGAEKVNRDIIVSKYKHMVRRDGYGSRWITPEFTNMYVNEFFKKKIPSYAEVCYWHLGNYQSLKQHFDVEPELEFTGNMEKDLRKYFELCMRDVQKFRANVMDARVPSDWRLWTTIAGDLIDKFGIENGYRLVPMEFSYPKVIKLRDELLISHKWKNTAYGFMPIVDNQLSGKYRISFALLNDDNTVAYQYIDKNSEPSWIKEDGEVELNTLCNVPSTVKSGEYKLAVSIVYTDSQKPAINLATKMEKIPNIPSTDDPLSWYGGWYVIGDIIVV
jgi:hypothetical protein